jgi:TIR domain
MVENVFISWSGATSRAVAEALYEWLPSVIQAVDPWMSSEDIPKGAEWQGELLERLQKTKIGIVCLTPDNLGSPWLLFEAGALSKALGQNRVCPYLFGLEPGDVERPLGIFQSTKADKTDTIKLLVGINAALGEAGLSKEHLQQSFEMWWPKLDEELKAIMSAAGKAAVSVRRPEREMIEEILEIVRDQARLVQRERQAEMAREIAARWLGRTSRPLGAVAEATEFLGFGAAREPNYFKKLAKAIKEKQAEEGEETGEPEKES